MFQEQTDLVGGWPLDEGDQPAQPRMLGPQAPAGLDTRALDERHSGAYRMCIHEHGAVSLVLPQHDVIVLDPAEAFDLLDFLFAHRNLLAAQSAQIAEQQTEMQRA